MSTIIIEVKNNKIIGLGAGCRYRKNTECVNVPNDLHNIEFWPEKNSIKNLSNFLYFAKGYLQKPDLEYSQTFIMTLLK